MDKLILEIIFWEAAIIITECRLLMEYDPAILKIFISFKNIKIFYFFKSFFFNLKNINNKKKK